MRELILQYSTSYAFSSMIVRRLTHSPFSHVDIVLPGEGLLGASGAGRYRVAGRMIDDPGGVRIRPFEAWPYQLKKTVRISTPQAAAVITRAHTQIGKPFDHGALWMFLGDRPGARDWRDEAAWFCSELVVWAEEAEAVFSWPLIVAKDRVSPADSLIVNNPLIVPADIFELRQLLHTDMPLPDPH